MPAGSGRNEVGNRIRETRLTLVNLRGRHCSQADIADERTDLDPVTLCRIERGRQQMSVYTLCQISASLVRHGAIYATVGYLLTGKEERGESETRDAATDQATGEGT